METKTISFSDKLNLFKESLDNFKFGINTMLIRRSYLRKHLLPTLRDKIDYNVIGGRKCLSKAGIERLASIFQLSATFTKDEATMSAFPGIKNMIAYKCTLVGPGNELRGEGRGSALLENHENNPNLAIHAAIRSSFADGVIRISALSSDFYSQDILEAPEVMSGRS